MSPDFPFDFFPPLSAVRATAVLVSFITSSNLVNIPHISATGHFFALASSRFRAVFNTIKYIMIIFPLGSVQSILYPYL